eukprot:1182902-Prorocentrum_minimum.AAC.1
MGACEQHSSHPPVQVQVGEVVACLFRTGSLGEDGAEGRAGLLLRGHPVPRISSVDVELPVEVQGGVRPNHPNLQLGRPGVGGRKRGVDRVRSQGAAQRRRHGSSTAVRRGKGTCAADVTLTYGERACDSKRLKNARA